MKDVSTLLREADPAAGDPGLSDAQVQTMRRAVTNAARTADAPAFSWRPSLAVAAAVALTLVAGIIGGRQMPGPHDTNLPVSEPARLDEGPRQLQFATPGGTRIIWVLDPDFDLKETTP